MSAQLASADEGERHNGSRREREVDRYTLLHCNACKMEWRWYIQGVHILYLKKNDNFMKQWLCFGNIKYRLQCVK